MFSRGTQEQLCGSAGVAELLQDVLQEGGTPTTCNQGVAAAESDKNGSLCQSIYLVLLDLPRGHKSLGLAVVNPATGLPIALIFNWASSVEEICAGVLSCDRQLNCSAMSGCMSQGDGLGASLCSALKENSRSVNLARNLSKKLHEGVQVEIVTTFFTWSSRNEITSLKNC